MEDETQQDIPTAGDVEQSYIDNQQDYADYATEVQEEQQFGSYPNQVSRETIFTFFKHILGIKDSSKVGNLDKRELGMLDLSVRNCEYLAKLGGMLHNRAYNEFFMQKAEITLATSMSKKGWLPELVVSQKRYSQRSVQPMTTQQTSKGFLGMGGGKTETVQQPQ